MARTSIAFRPYFSFYAFFIADSSLWAFNQTVPPLKGPVGSHLCSHHGMILEGITWGYIPM